LALFNHRRIGVIQMTKLQFKEIEVVSTLKQSKTDLIKHLVKMYAIYDEMYTKDLFENSSTQAYKKTKRMRDSVMDEIVLEYSRK
jgi:hypothetical protein